MRTVLEGLEVASPYLLLAALYYVAVFYPVLKVREVLRRRRAAALRQAVAE